jgi:ABC-type transport system involved in cytochrome bd biosynthesis fused ATPase/permease subunit
MLKNMNKKNKPLWLKIIGGVSGILLVIAVCALLYSLGIISVRIGIVILLALFLTAIIVIILFSLKRKHD